MQFRSREGQIRPADGSFEPPDASHAIETVSDDDVVNVNPSLASDSLSRDFAKDSKEKEKGGKKCDSMKHDSAKDNMTDESGSSMSQEAKDAIKCILELQENIERVEDRVGSLENRSKKLKLRSIKKTRSMANGDPVNAAGIPELCRVSFAQFKNRINDKEKNCAIQALVGPVKYYYNCIQGRKPSEAGDEAIDWTEQGFDDGRQRVDRVRINSTPVREILSKIIDKTLPAEPFVVLHPFKMLVCHDAKIRETLSNLETKWAMAEAQNVEEKSEKLNVDRMADSVEALRDMRCLVQFMDEEAQPIIQSLGDGTRESILFRDLWHLFKPGDEVFVPLSNTAESVHIRGEDVPARLPPGRYQEDWRVMGTGGGRANMRAERGERMAPRQKINPFELCCYYIDFDGQRFDPRVESFLIYPFEGERKITSLEAYPSKYHQDAAERRAALQSRGDMFRQLATSASAWYCSGTTVTCHPCGCAYGGESEIGSPEDVESQVIVDFGEAIRVNESLNPLGRSEVSLDQARELEDDFPTCLWTNNEQQDYEGRIYDLIFDDYLFCDEDLMGDFVSSDPLLRANPDPAVLAGKGMRDEDLILLPSRVLAFVLQNKGCAAVKIDDLKPIKRCAEKWDDLKLPGGYKHMLEAAVTSHLVINESSVSTKGEVAKYGCRTMHNKAQGLTILLHGVSGVGKTSTAVRLAEAYGKPLLPILCGDLSLTALDDLEYELANRFRLAQKWGCILLLDEADVFLTRKTRDDVKQSRRVSIFFRALETFKGIAFLTTNTADEIEDSIKSRIVLPLYLPPLTEELTISIWNAQRHLCCSVYGGRIFVGEKEIIAIAKYQYKLCKQSKTIWNGRQVRNAFKIAAALAQSHDTPAQSLHGERKNTEGPTLHKITAKHFEQVIEASLQFNRSTASAVGDRMNSPLEKEECSLESTTPTQTLE